MHYVDDVVRICPNQAHVNPCKAIRLVPCSSMDLLVEAYDDETNWEGLFSRTTNLHLNYKLGITLLFQ
jgi:hypothetical protein